MGDGRKGGRNNKIEEQIVEGKNSLDGSIAE